MNETRVPLEERLLGDRPLVDVDAEAGDAGLDPRRLVRTRRERLDARTEQRVACVADRVSRTEHVDAVHRRPVGSDDPPVAPRHVTVGRRRERRRAPTAATRGTASCPRTSSRSQPSLRSSISAFDPDPVATQRRGELRAVAGVAVEPPARRADAQRAEVDVELALRRAGAASATPSPSSTRSRSCDTRLCEERRGVGPRHDDHAVTAGARRSRVLMALPCVSEREPPGRAGGGEQRLGLVVALEVLVDRDPSRRRSRRRPTRSRCPSRHTIVRIAIAVSRLPEKSR